jgi:hypothetical protein
MATLVRATLIEQYKFVQHVLRLCGLLRGSFANRIRPPKQISSGQGALVY